MSPFVEKLKTRSRLLFRLLQGNQEARHAFGLRVSRLIDKTHYYGDYGQEWPKEAAKIVPYFATPYEVRRRLDRLFVLHQLASTAPDDGGSIVEMGVHRGVTAAVLLGANNWSEYWGYDSFEGLSSPVDSDGDYWSKGDLSVSKSVAEAHLAPFAHRTHLVQGWIPDCFTTSAGPDRISLAHIDVDIYEPTLASLRYCDERARRGTVVVCDDYGFSTCPGARRAVDEFVGAGQQWSKLHLTSGQAVLTCVR